MRPTPWPWRCAMSKRLNFARASTPGPHELPPPTLFQKPCRAARTAALRFRASEPCDDTEPPPTQALAFSISCVDLRPSWPSGSRQRHHHLPAGIQPRVAPPYLDPKPSAGDNPPPNISNRRAAPHPKVSHGRPCRLDNIRQRRPPPDTS